jgi:uroporphyrinogen III methyltransferase/synthase
VRFDILIFLSGNAVRCFDAIAGEVSTQWRDTVVAAVGERTADVARSLGWRVTVVPDVFNGRTLVGALGEIKNKRCLVPRVEDAPDDILRLLRKKGAVVDVVPVYRNEPLMLPSALKREVLDGVDGVLFTSTSTVAAFLKNFSPAQRRRVFRRAHAVSIGAQTSAALRRNGVHRIRQARNASVENLVLATRPLRR